MPKDEHVAVLARGAAQWNAWRAERDEAPDLSQAALRGLDLTEFDLSRADLRGADLRGTTLRDADLSDAHLEGANFFKAVLDGADLAGADLDGAQFLNCAQLIVTRNWQFGLPRCDACLWCSNSRSGVSRIGGRFSGRRFAPALAAQEVARHRRAEVHLAHGYRVTCADTASHFPSRRAQTSV
jgi:hypothetical protein